MKSEIKYEEIIKEGEISTEKDDNSISINQDILPIGKSIWTKIVKYKNIIKKLK